jgi:hypothetical protein
MLTSISCKGKSQWEVANKTQSSKLKTTAVNLKAQWVNPRQRLLGFAVMVLRFEMFSPCI